MGRYRGRFQNPNEPETGVNCRQHAVHTDTMGLNIKTDEPAPSEGKTEAINGYRVIARRPRSETFTESVEPEKAQQIEDFSKGIMPYDRW